ncbi:NADPH-dependent FMN reductase [Rhodococcus sp. NPDC058521]|uniref:NADPH-dependent FMN reductase n=1 Tax=Rhodococcus sp. NPDC058521 TaxID=3346536 RepID=UPI00366537AF
MKLLTISGSLRTGSFNTRMLGFAEDLASVEGHRIRRFDRVREIPPFDEDHEPRVSEVVEDLRARIRSSDAVLIATPEYSGSVPGQLKNLLDWAARPAGLSVFAGKPTAVISASPSNFGAAWAREAAEHILTQMGADVLSTGWGLSRVHERGVADTAFIDEDDVQRLRTIVEQLSSIRTEGVLQ